MTSGDNVFDRDVVAVPRVRRIRGDAVRLRRFAFPGNPHYACRVHGRHHDWTLSEWCAGIAGSGHGVDVVFPVNRAAGPGLGLCRRHQLRAGRVPDKLDGRFGRHVGSPTVATKRHRPQSGRAVHATEYGPAAVHARHHRWTVSIDHTGGTLNGPGQSIAIAFIPPCGAAAMAIHAESSRRAFAAGRASAETHCSRRRRPARGATEIPSR